MDLLDSSFFATMERMFKVCIIEDDSAIREEMTVLLERNGYEVSAVRDFVSPAQEALRAASDIILLDLGLPSVDGHVVCREIRTQSDVPIIVVTSRDNDLDELMSMNLGADDFITKPFHPQILLARIARILERTHRTSPEKTLSYQGIVLDISQTSVSYEGRSIELTKNEMRILGLLIERAETVVSREDIQNELWQSDEFIDDNTLTVNVNRLRATLTKIGLEEVLHTKRGIGYLLKL